MKKGERKSIFTADDFGATEFINMGTNRGIEKGLINSVAVMVNFPGAIDNIADLKKKHPHISLGLHANITAGYPVSPANAVPSLVDDQGHFHTLQELIRRIRQIKVKEVLLEIRAQLGILHPDYLGDAFWGNPTAENLRHILHNQPEGITEWVFHLGYSAEYGKSPKLPILSHPPGFPTDQV
jgi:hypothetical protein